MMMVCWLYTFATASYLKWHIDSNRQWRMSSYQRYTVTCKRTTMRW
jgi:hypothetical protein